MIKDCKKKDNKVNNLQQIKTKQSNEPKKYKMDIMISLSNMMKLPKICAQNRKIALEYKVHNMES
jgi:hypothetical protein